VAHIVKHGMMVAIKSVREEVRVLKINSIAARPLTATRHNNEKRMVMATNERDMIAR